MPKKTRVVLDTNVLVSGTIATQGFPSRIFDAAVDKEVVLVVSSFILTEYFDVLKRPHILRKYPKLNERARLFTEYLQKRAKQVNPIAVERIVPDDAKDDAILACAKEGKAQYIVSGDEHLLQLSFSVSCKRSWPTQYIVSGDEHLLQLREYTGIKILTPRAFVEQVL